MVKKIFITTLIIYLVSIFVFNESIFNITIYFLFLFAGMLIMYFATQLSYEYETKKTYKDDMDEEELFKEIEALGKEFQKALDDAWNEAFNNTYGKYKKYKD
ncbi:MAG: hypothetical protein KatS3mg129_1238 [Leptospiraceae bacterium]|nr:MAG: hypothetical protein KatS3mg129_1238 [Leptospiraceae bacterium]